MRKRQTTEKVSLRHSDTSWSKKPRSRSWKEYFATAPRLPSDFPKRIRDRRPEKVKPL